MKDEQELRRILEEANQAKDRLASIASKLQEKGYIRKAKSCMLLVYRIEEWQNKT